MTQLACAMQGSGGMEIPIEIAFRGMTKSPAVESFVREWVAKLEGVYDRIERCDVVVEAPHRRRRRGNQYRVRVTMSVPGGQLVVSHDPGLDESHQDVHVAVRDTFHAARRQLEDHIRRNLRRDIKAVEEPAHARVSFLDVERDWGTLEDTGGRSIYFHRNAVLGGVDGLEIGDEVRFAEEAGDKGPQASSVEKIGAHGHHAMHA